MLNKKHTGQNQPTYTYYINLLPEFCASTWTLTNKSQQYISTAQNWPFHQGSTRPCIFIPQQAKSALRTTEQPNSTEYHLQEREYVC